MRREVSHTNSAIPPASLYCRVRNSYVEAENIPTTKQPYGVRSPVASDVLLSALDGHHVAVDYRGYRILAEGRPWFARTHFPFCIVAFRYFVRVQRTRASTMITLMITWLDAFTHPGEKFHTGFCKQDFSTWTYYSQNRFCRVKFLHLSR